MNKFLLCKSKYFYYVILHWIHTWIFVLWHFSAYCTAVFPNLAATALLCCVSIEVAEDFKLYHMCNLQLSTEHGGVIWGSQVVVPAHLQATMLQTLHDMVMP